MSKGRGRSRNDDGELDMTPMIDIVFQLIIFFIVTITITKEVNPEIELPDAKRVTVWDSTADMRYMVLPQRPADTDDLSEDELAERVTRDGMIGTALV